MKLKTVSDGYQILLSLEIEGLSEQSKVLGPFNRRLRAILTFKYQGSRVEFTAPGMSLRGG